MSRLAFPFAPATSGRSTAVEEGDPDHVRQMLELLILTVPGERIMQPTLGSATMQMLFGSANGPAAAALEATLAATITQNLGTYLTLQGLTVAYDDASAALEITVDYWLIDALAPGRLTVSRSAG
jgi:hypothetical protein